MDKGAELLAQVRQEIEQAMKHVAFWSEQAQLQAGTEFEEITSSTAADAKMMLEHLEQAEEALLNAQGS